MGPPRGMRDLGQDHDDPTASGTARTSLGRAGLARVLACILVLGTVAIVYGAGTASASTTRWTPGGKDIGYTPKFDKSTCPSAPAMPKGTRCGFLVVPENRDDPGGRKLHLAVFRVPSTSSAPKSDPIIYLDGGPGAPTVASIAALTEQGINRDREIIFLAYRGTLSSKPTPLVCPDIDTFYQQRVGLGVDNPKTLQLYLKATSQCRAQLTSKGVDLSAYNTFENAADVADLRTVLRIRQWNVYSHSYGTDLALVYMRLYPQGIRSVTLDGTVPPSVASLGWTWSSLKESFDNVVAACQAQAACRAAYPNFGLAQFVSLVNQLEAHPVSTTVTVPDVGPVKVTIDGGTLVNWWARASHEAATIPMALNQLANGNPQLIADQWATSWYPGTGGKFAWGLAFSVWCSEYVPFQTNQQYMAAALASWPGLPLSVLESATPQLSGLRQACAVWNVPKASDSIRTVTRSTIPTLEISGSFDAQTGAAWGTYAALTLPDSTTVTLAGVPHGTYPNACADDVITSFFDNPKAPNTSCVASVQPPPFAIGS